MFYSGYWIQIAIPTVREKLASVAFYDRTTNAHVTRENVERGGASSTELNAAPRDEGQPQSEGTLVTRAIPGHVIEQPPALRPTFYHSLPSGSRLCRGKRTSGQGVLRVENGTREDAALRSPLESMCTKTDNLGLARNRPIIKKNSQQELRSWQRIK